MRKGGPPSSASVRRSVSRLRSSRLHGWAVSFVGQSVHAHQQLTSSDCTPFADQNQLDDSCLGGLHDPEVRARHQLAVSYGDDVELAEGCPDDQRDDKGEQGPPHASPERYRWAVLLAQQRWSKVGYRRFARQALRRRRCQLAPSRAEWLSQPAGERAGSDHSKLSRPLGPLSLCSGPPSGVPASAASVGARLLGKPI